VLWSGDVSFFGGSVSVIQISRALDHGSFLDLELRYLGPFDGRCDAARDNGGGEQRKRRAHQLL
jgi:hypothetical protein